MNENLYAVNQPAVRLNRSQSPNFGALKAFNFSN